MIAIYIIICVVLGFIMGYLTMKQSAIKQQNNITTKLNEKLNKSEKDLAVALYSLKQQQIHNQELKKEYEKQVDTKHKLLQEEIKNITSQLIKDSKDELNSLDKERLENVLKPLNEKMEAFENAVNKSNIANASNVTKITTSFFETIKALQENQDKTVKALQEQTSNIGLKTEELTNALKGDTKIQGDWGEFILERTLEDCGLTKDEHFFMQENFKGDNNNNIRPDAVVKFPNNELLIIDAKVSLTSYLKSIQTNDKEEQEKLLKEHLLSVKKHIDELKSKNYIKNINNSIGFVLMFISNEGGYAAAIKQDKNILQYGYKNQVIIISPANLLMTLQLTFNMWKRYNVNKNVEQIMKTSNDLYDKFVTFAETFIKIDEEIKRLRITFDKAQNQLNYGKGNIIKRFDDLKKLGITSKKDIPESIQTIKNIE